MSPEANFGSILDRPSNTIERPKPLPVGSYLCRVQGMPRYDKSSRKGTEFVEFTLAVLQPLEDVDQEALTEMGGFQGKTIRATYYLTEDSVFRLKDFLDHCGAGDDSMSLRERNEQTANCSVIATIKHEASQDGESIFARLAKTAPAE